MRTRPANFYKMIDLKSCSMRLKGTNQEEVHTEIIENLSLIHI